MARHERRGIEIVKEETTTPCSHCGKPVIVKVGSYYLAIGRYTCSAECQITVLHSTPTEKENKNGQSD